MGGPSIFPELPKAVLATASRPGHAWGKSPPDEANRRSVYVKVKRSLLVPILNQYDQADTDSTCPVRFATTVPTQSLTMLNGKFHQRPSPRFRQQNALGRGCDGRRPCAIRAASLCCVVNRNQQKFNKR